MATRTVPQNPNPQKSDAPEAEPNTLSAEDLVAAGAQPVQISEADLRQLIATMQSQQDKANAQIAALMAERGIPADPIEAALQALGDHLRVQADANPSHSAAYTDVRDYADALTSDGLTERKAARLVRYIEDLRALHPGHELAYVAALARELHTSTLDDTDE